ncbi:MAG TPA: PQQ-binding-like beta-propeller repeat protein [Bryobacteraceae bacterium]|jgi:outer membrane protein assembly factor BamB
MKHLQWIAICLLLGSCAKLMNSNRPAYHGPIVKALWHNSSLRIDRPPVIHNGVVYAAGHPWTGHDFRRVFAFDLKTGQQLWMSDFAAEKVLLATDSIVFVPTLGGGQVHTLDAATGKDITLVYPVSFEDASIADGVLYTTTFGRVEARSMATYLKDLKIQSRLDHSKALWQVHIPIDASRGIAPAVAGDGVYVASFQDFRLEPRHRDASAVYALDSKTGDVRWSWEPDSGRKDVPIPYGITADASGVYVWLHDISESVIGKGILLALDAETGREKWRHKTSIYVHSCPSPLLIAPDQVLACDYPAGDQGSAIETGFLYQRLNRETGKKMGESQTSWKYESYVAADGKLFVSDHQVHEVLTENNNNSPDSWVTAVSLDTGKELWRSQTLVLGILTTPAAGEGVVVVGSDVFKWGDPGREGKHDVAGLWAWTIEQ